MYSTQLWFLFHFFYWHPILPWDFNTNSPYAFLTKSYKVRPLCLIISGLKTGLLCFFSDLIILHKIKYYLTNLRRQEAGTCWLVWLLFVLLTRQNIILLFPPTPTPLKVTD